jgi:hypothetical protein
MSTLRNGLIGLGVFVFSQTLAADSPIQVNLFGTVDGHPVDQSVTLSDPSQTISIPIAYQMLMASSGPNGYYGGGNINSSFNLSVSVGATGSSPAADDTVGVSGTIHGSYSIDSYLNPNMSGSVNGTGTSASIFLAPGTSLAEASPYLTDLLSHPGRVGYVGGVTGGSQNLLQTTLSITPPVDPPSVLPVPEPSMVAIVLMTLMSLPIARRLRSS